MNIINVSTIQKYVELSWKYVYMLYKIFMTFLEYIAEANTYIHGNEKVIKQALNFWVYA